MDVSDNNAFCNVVGLVKACIPWRSEAALESRAFWIPDRSCRECYECWSEFSFLNRRHHCRHCGQIFCAECTSNRLPATSAAANKVRVCNYCFRQWQQILNPHESSGGENIDHSAREIERNSYEEGEDTESVNFENVGLLWLPPEPQYEEGEKDDDRSSSENADYRSKGKLINEEHKRSVIKNVLDGHLRASIAKLLQEDNLHAGEQNDRELVRNYLSIIMESCPTLLKLDMVGPMDPRAYVKVKCLASGVPSESMVIKGVVCNKNVVHKRMASTIEKPRLLIFVGDLGYQRYSNNLSSFDNLLCEKQEMDRLKKALTEIDAQRSDILLVEKSVSRDAQDYLLERDISFVVNVKRPLLEHIAWCTGTPIVSSIDDLSSNSFGHCDIFHVDKFIEEHGITAGQSKTLMYFEGCPNTQCCTILLRGANVDELKKLKHVIQYGVFTAYHLSLETSFLVDEGACLSQLPLNSSTTEERGKQSIFVSLSSRCLWKGTVCVRSHLLRIKHYGNFDKPLGRFLQDDLFDENDRCRSCEMPTEAHVHCYTHKKGTVTISVKRLVDIVLPGERDGKIWVWHRCLKCPRNDGFPPVRKRVVMSFAALSISFGKFLELSFLNEDDTIVGSCGHSLHRDCLRFYGFGKMVACFRYASIDVRSGSAHL